MTNPSSAPTSADILAELKRTLGNNVTYGNIEQRIAQIHRMQQELQQFPTVGGGRFVKRIIHRLTNFLFFRYFQIDLELVNLSQSIYHELQGQITDNRVQINRDMIQLHRYYGDVLQQYDAEHTALLTALAAAHESLDGAAENLEAGSEEARSEKVTTMRAVEQLVANLDTKLPLTPPTLSSTTEGLPQYSIAPPAAPVSTTISNGTVEPPDPPSKEAAAAFLKKFDYWYQRIYLGNGHYSWQQPTFHELVWDHVQPTFPRSLAGKNVLDVGANAGFFSISAKRLGAERVVALEIMPHYIEQGQFCASVWGTPIEYQSVDIDAIEQLDTQFDVVIFLAILYHLKNPLKTLETVGKVCSDVIILETEIVPPDERNVIYARWGRRGVVPITRLNTGFMKFIERDELNDDPTNWWIPDIEALMGMMRTAGFKYFSEPIYHMEGRVLLVASKRHDSAFRLDALG